MKKIVSLVCLIITSMFVFVGCGKQNITSTIKANNTAFLTEMEITTNTNVPLDISANLITAYNTIQNDENGFYVGLDDLELLLEYSMVPYYRLNYTMEDKTVQKKTKDLKKLNKSLNDYYASVKKIEKTIKSMEKTLSSNDNDPDSLLNADYRQLKSEITLVLSNTVTYTRDFTTMLKSIYNTIIVPDMDLINSNYLQIEAINAYNDILDVYVTIYLKNLNTQTVIFNTDNNITANDLFNMIIAKNIFLSNDLESTIIITQPNDLLTMQNLFTTFNSNISILHEVTKAFNAENFMANVAQKYPLANPTTKVNDYLINHATALEKSQYNLINNILHNAKQAYISLFENSLL